MEKLKAVRYLVDNGIFCLNDIKKFLYLLKRRRRRNFRAKTFNFGQYSQNILHLLDFKINHDKVSNKK